MIKRRHNESTYKEQFSHKKHIKLKIIKQDFGKSFTK